MQKKIADAIGGGQSNLSIKATTNEKLGAIGRGEGIAAMAVATVEIAERGRQARRKGG
jgi:2-C-methyl-D-erythritol 2,4-cyclodiphosphate synthase